MINPQQTIKLKMKGSQNEENWLELDPERIIGWMGYPDATGIIIDGPDSHCFFTVDEDVVTIKKKLQDLRDSM